MGVLLGILIVLGLLGISILLVTWSVLQAIKYIKKEKKIMNFPTISQIRFPKLILHSLLLVSILTLISIITQNVISWIFNTDFSTVNGLASFLVMIWIFFAIQNKKYQKEA